MTTSPDRIDTAALRLAARLIPGVASEIAAVLRRLGVSPAFLDRPRQLAVRGLLSNARADNARQRGHKEPA